MQFRQFWKISALGLALTTIQACASAPDVEPQKTSREKSDHIKTEVPPPFPITPESLRKEREEAARRKAADKEVGANE